MSAPHFFVEQLDDILDFVSFLTGLFATIMASRGLSPSNPLYRGWSILGLILGILEISCTLIYIIPRTAVLGAILLTGYLGGATATHVRISDPKVVVPIIVGILIWLGLFLRDRRVRALIPFRES